MEITHLKMRIICVPGTLAKIASSIGALFLIFVLYYVIMASQSQSAVRHISKSISSRHHVPKPRGYDDTQSVVNNDVTPFQEMEQSTSNLGIANVSSLPTALYNMARPVFDALPDRYLPGYKSSCWELSTINMTNGDEESNIRCLPYFYILGMPKCGTSDLWDKIVKHPQVINGILKEPHWWTRGRINRHNHLGNTFDSYLKDRSAKLVDMFSQDPSNEGQLVAGDGSASTLWDNSQWMDIFGQKKDGPEFVTVDILRAVQPRAKLLVILREPVARLYSGYLYFHSNTSPERFHEVTVETIARYRECTERMSHRACAYTISIHRSVRLLLGLYSVYIRDLLRAYPRDQLFILRLEDWHAGCPDILPNIYSFLNLRHLSGGKIAEICRTRAKNTNKGKANRVGDMLNKTRTILQDFYSEWNQELSELLDDESYLWQY